MADRKRVLVTGGAGLIGSILIDRLSDRYEFTSFDLKKAKNAESVVGDLSDLVTVEKAFANQDTIVHLAADRSAQAEWESALKNNFVSTYNVFEAAKRNGVKRVVFASSQHATGGFYLDEPWKHIVDGNFDKLEHGQYELLDETCQIRPDGYYGTSKAYGEALGSYYLDYHGLASMHLRIGWVLSEDNPTFSPFALSLWLSHRDVAQITGLCIDAPESQKYGIYYATSDNKWKIWDISRAKKELGYQPEDTAGEEFTPGPPPARDQ